MKKIGIGQTAIVATPCNEYRAFSSSIGRANRMTGLSPFCLLAALVFSLDAVETFSQERPIKPPSLHVVRVEGGIRIDGQLDEKAWEKAAVIDRFIQREPQEGRPCSERTEVRILYDERNLYIAFRCWDSDIRNVVANEMRRDISLLDNDCIEIYLDTYHDHRTAFYFSTNPLGAQRDGIITANLSDEEQNWDWNGVWDNASSIDGAGWTAEIAIPFQTLRFQSGEGTIWGINLARVIPRKREEAYWSPISRDFGWTGKYRVEVYGHLIGLGELMQPGDLEVKPFALVGTQRDFEEGGPVERKLMGGIDAKYHLTPNLTVDLSWNTDFAQVEADQEQTNLTRFELFYPEKRDFFLEGAAIFRFGERFYSPFLPASVLFFSRRIGLSEDNTMIPLLGGVKITGKAGSLNVGLLNMTAERSRYTNEDDEFKVVPRTNFSVLRLRQDILANSSIGLIALNKQSLDDANFNRNVGLDATIYLTPNTQVSGFLAKTSTPNMRGRDLAAYGDFYYNDDFWTLLVTQNTVQDNFNPEMGFFPRTGIRKSELSFGISPRPKFLNIRQLALFDDFYYITNQRGELESRWNYTGFYSQFQDGSWWFAILSTNYEWLTEDFEIHDGVNIVPGDYRFTNLMSQFQSDMSKSLSATLSVNAGDFYDGTLYGYGIGANLKLGSRLTLNLQFNHNEVKLSAGPFTTTILGARVLYTFSPKLFAKAFIQWNSDNYAVSGNFLVSFIHTPGSDLFLVYNEELSTGGKELRTNNRTVMLKFTYLFNL
jgi:hypothetical protein